MPAALGAAGAKPHESLTTRKGWDIHEVPGSPQGTGLVLLPSSPLAVVPLPLLPPAHFSPPQLILSPAAPEGPGEKGCSPLQPPAHAAKHRLDAGKGHLILGRTEEPGDTHGEERTPGKPTPPSALPGAPSIPEVAVFVSCDTALSPWSPRAVPSQHPAGMATEPRAPLVSPGMLAPATLTSFPFPFLPWGSNAGCFPCAAAEPEGGRVLAAPAVPGARGPGRELGPAAPGSPRLLCSSRARRAG